LNSCSFRFRGFADIQAVKVAGGFSRWTAPVLVDGNEDYSGSNIGLRVEEAAPFGFCPDGFLVGGLTFNDETFQEGHICFQTPTTLWDEDDIRQANMMMLSGLKGLVMQRLHAAEFYDKSVSIEHHSLIWVTEHAPFYAARGTLSASQVNMIFPEGAAIQDFVGTKEYIFVFGQY
jgi:hypothetical protein